MKIMRIINDELIDLREYRNANATFNTNEYCKSDDICIFHEQINPFDLYYENKEKGKEIERLNNIIDKAIHYINLNQDSKSLCLNYNQLKALRGILRQDEFYLRLFEEQLKELKGSEEE